ncbi:MAG: hypothetical protein ACLPTM_17435 [Steroidobacteraceae bacterium]
MATTLALGAVLFLAAVLSGIVRANALRTTLGRLARTAIAVGGLVLMAVALASYLARGPQRAAPPAPRASLSAQDLVRAASTALEACSAPNVPTLPNGARASLAEMEATHTAFEAYDAATRAYTQCVDSTVARIARKSAAAASGSDLEALTTFGARAHNVAIDKEKASVDLFNAQLQDYKARHGK